MWLSRDSTLLLLRHHAPSPVSVRLKETIGKLKGVENGVMLAFLLALKEDYIAVTSTRDPTLLIPMSVRPHHV